MAHRLAEKSHRRETFGHHSLLLNRRERRKNFPFGFPVPSERKKNFSEHEAKLNDESLKAKRLVVVLRGSIGFDGSPKAALPAIRVPDGPLQLAQGDGSIP